MIGKFCYRRLEKDRKYAPIWAGSKLAILVYSDYWTLENHWSIQKVIDKHVGTTISEKLEVIKSVGINKGKCLIDVPVDLSLWSNRKLGRSDRKIGLDYEPVVGLIIGDSSDYFRPIKTIELLNIKSLKWSLEYKADEIMSSDDIQYIMDSFRLYSACIDLLTKIP